MALASTGRGVLRAGCKFHEGVFAGLKAAVEQYAWLYATPKAPSKDQKHIAKEGSRLKRFQDDGWKQHLPEAPLPYLLDLFFEIGPTEAGGMGPSPLTQEEIRAWQENNILPFAELQPWEVTVVRKLSFAWIEMSSKAEEPDCPEPIPVANAPQFDPLLPMKAAMRRKAGL